MDIFTRYLNVRAVTDGPIAVSITAASPIALFVREADQNSTLRYSPIFPAFLLPGEPPPPIPQALTSIVFFFSRVPYKALGKLKPELVPAELNQVYFTQGLASILCLNCDLSQARHLCKLLHSPLLEYWPLEAAAVNPADVVIEPVAQEDAPGNELELRPIPEGELAVYLEQIYASLVTLRQSYRTYNPAELKTIEIILTLTGDLTEQYDQLTQKVTGDLEQALGIAKRRYAILAALTELSASLSYAVTQGTSGAAPILTNPSPFPHLSLLGVGGAVRALTKFTRYLETAFAVRDAAAVIGRGYSRVEVKVPASIATYSSGKEYTLAPAHRPLEEEFDRGGEFPQNDNTPLITYFSLRHGFKESKFSLTAASETLTTEVSPQWTMMTLSHEIMHSRVRMIFQALFGATWEEDRESVLSQRHYYDFKEWYESRGEKPVRLDSAIRNAVLNFCCALDRSMDVRTVRRAGPERNIPGLIELGESYGRHKTRAMELFVHFHDYYFAYACQPMTYVMSLWASWIGVAAPYKRPMEYLVRTLATVACGTGAEPDVAFETAVDVIKDAFTALGRAGIRSPLIDKVRGLLGDSRVYANFMPSYYLIDQVRRFFASRRIALRIDRIEYDPFAEGSTAVNDYSANVFVYGEEDEKSFVSPIRYSLSSLARSLLGQSQIDDSDWLTAWNTMVISSQEIQNVDTGPMQQDLHGRSSEKSRY